ncbi:hypothetical protein [Nonomuraea rhizosphaerae]|uniref:hypothetical protein n=1 Tax=Nonomuraea rhizosphaerae TaxID=2665663 RepID=UPI001C5D99E7|nr:hypothetical protein [Nonomuraea rhizosphaerae]
MIFLGLILVLLSCGAIALVATEESPRYILFGYTFEFDHVGMFLAGAATAAVLLLGIAMISSGSRRSAKRRRALRTARAEEAGRVARLETEKRELQRKLEDERAHETHEAPVTHAAPEESDRLVAGRHAEDVRR